MERIKAAKDIDGESVPPKKADNEEEDVGKAVEGEESAGAPVPVPALAWSKSLDFVLGRMCAFCV
jgi:hypothetical protein